MSNLGGGIQERNSPIIFGREYVGWRCGWVISAPITGAEGHGFEYSLWVGFLKIAPCSPIS